MVATLPMESLFADTPPPPQQLPALAASVEDVSVIGVSSGGYMATQLAVAWPERFAGLGVLAAGPWSCAQGSLGVALGQCMTTQRGMPDMQALEQRLASYRERGLVGEAEALASLRVYVWHGGADAVVEPRLGEALVEQFQGWLSDPSQLQWRRDADAGHGWPVDATLGKTDNRELADCHDAGPPYLLACDNDIAGDVLNWLHGDLTPPADGETPGKLRRFDQGDYDARGLADTGYLFVPKRCEEGGCMVSMALHGCNMTTEQIGEAFVGHTGLNAWAAENRRIVLYPQAETRLGNPQGCWDWWGYAESSWQLDPMHDSRQGTQTRALMAMLQRLQEKPAR
ncbi:extracellular catalytic domain type 2 short-chain-length polyhydroxyalkanoate depolymerase [Halomonas marinisediminis]|uniref:Poly(3-hydroxybutyrate) depolymerase n=1 Tax=Halomonas marinisediminis TaxID=2546095 RepID=A0ABY2DD18_9GAMM|nr:PHB depolymerase family esterase [Halomonas marinisediminis]TDB03277.1 poly(3-hydroxybutyrate) depolymerase [Halomonas marinisediminis]